MRKKKYEEDFRDCSYEEKLYRQANLRRKVEYGHILKHTGKDEPSPWRENAVKHYEEDK